MPKGVAIFIIAATAGILLGAFLVLSTLMLLPSRGITDDRAITDSDPLLATAAETAREHPDTKDWVFHPDWGLNPRIAKEIGLSPPETENANRVFLSFAETLRHRDMRFAQTLEASPSKIVFEIQGTPEKAAAIEHDLRNSLESFLGEPRTNALFAFGDGQLSRDFRQFGAVDQRIVFERVPNGNDDVLLEACFRREGEFGSEEVRTPVPETARDRWLEHVPDDYGHLVFLIPPVRP